MDFDCRLSHQAEWGQSRIEAFLSEQQADDLFVQLEVVSQEWRLDMGGVRYEVEEIVPDERCVRGKVHSPRHLCLCRWAREVESEVDTRPFAGDIVLKEAHTAARTRKIELWEPRGIRIRSRSKGGQAEGGRSQASRGAV